MTATMPLWSEARNIGEMVGDDARRAAPKTERRCAMPGCGTILSQTNSFSVCYPCAARLTPEQPDTPTSALSQDELRLNDRLAVAMDAVRALPEVFTSGDLSRALNVRHNEACFLLRKLLLRGVVGQIGLIDSPVRRWRTVMAWRLAE